MSDQQQPKTYNYQGSALEYLELPTAKNTLYTIFPFLRPTLVFLPGFNDPWQNHVDLLELIAQRGYKVYGLNLPGHGNSAPVPNLSWEILEDIVISFCKQLKLKRLNLAGFSFGAGLALKLCENPALQLQGAYLISPFCKAVPVASLETLKELLLTGYQTLQHMNVVKKPAPMFSAKQSAYTVAEYAGVIASFNLNLPEIQKVHINIVTLENDNIIDPASVNSLLGKLPNVTIRPMQNMAHDIYFISPAQASELITLLFTK